MDKCTSGLCDFPAKEVIGNFPWVRIPPYPIWWVASSTLASSALYCIVSEMEEAIGFYSILGSND